MPLVTVVVTALVTAFATFEVKDPANMLLTVIEFVPDWVKILKLLVWAIVLVMLLSKDEFGQLDQYSMMDS